MADNVTYSIGWDATGERYFEAGTDRGVLYQIVNNAYTNGVAWNGLTAVNSTPGGAEPNELWADNIKYAVLRSAETYGGTIECYTYPDEFKQNNGEENIVEGAAGIVASGQARKAFGLSYRTKVGNDIDGLDHAYKIHLVYNATASPSEKAYATINDSPDAITMSYEFDTTPIAVTGTGLKKPTAHIEIDTAQLIKTDAEKAAAFIAALELKLYGDPEGATEADRTPSMPLPSELVTMYRTYFPS